VVSLEKAPAAETDDDADGKGQSNVDDEKQKSGGGKGHEQQQQQQGQNGNHNQPTFQYNMVQRDDRRKRQEVIRPNGSQLKYLRKFTIEFTPLTQTFWGKIYPKLM
jgi:hypothetical protein